MSCAEFNLAFLTVSSSTYIAFSGYLVCISLYQVIVLCSVMFLIFGILL